MTYQETERTYKTFEITDAPLKFSIACWFAWYCTDESVEVSISDHYLLFWPDVKIVEKDLYNVPYLEEVIMSEVRKYLIKEYKFKFEVINLKIAK